MSNIYTEVARKFVDAIKRLKEANKIDISEKHISYDEFEEDPIRMFISHAYDDFSLRLKFDVVNEDDVKYLRVEVCSGKYDGYDNIMHNRKFITRLRYELDDVMEDTLMDVLVVTINAICMNRYQEFAINPGPSKAEFSGGESDINPWML